MFSGNIGVFFIDLRNIGLLPVATCIMCIVKNTEQLAHCTLFLPHSKSVYFLNFSFNTFVLAQGGQKNFLGQSSEQHTTYNIKWRWPTIISWYKNLLTTKSCSQIIECIDGLLKLNWKTGLISLFKVVPYTSGKIWSASLILLFFWQCVWIYPL